MFQLVISIIVALVIIGVLLWGINKLLGPYMQPNILQLLNVAVVVLVAICVFFWILNAFGLLTLASGPPIPKLR